MVSAGNDRILKVWDYDQGTCIATGTQPSGAINHCQISPDKATVVSVGAEGAIYFWDLLDREGNVITMGGGEGGEGKTTHK